MSPTPFKYNPILPNPPVPTNLLNFLLTSSNSFNKPELPNIFYATHLSTTNILSNLDVPTSFIDPHFNQLILTHNKKFSHKIIPNSIQHNNKYANFLIDTKHDPLLKINTSDLIKISKNFLLCYDYPNFFFATLALDNKIRLKIFYNNTLYHEYPLLLNLALIKHLLLPIRFKTYKLPSFKTHNFKRLHHKIFDINQKNFYVYPNVLPHYVFRAIEPIL